MDLKIQSMSLVRSVGTRRQESNLQTCVRVPIEKLRNYE